jgi:hypothetical protein
LPSQWNTVALPMPPFSAFAPTTTYLPVDGIPRLNPAAADETGVVD